MDETEAVAALIGDIYDAALEPPLWPGVLAKLAGFVGGGQAATIYWKDAASKSGDSYYDTGVHPNYRRLYFDKYIKLDPTTTGYFFARVGDVVDVASVMSYEEFLHTRFYREWARPQGWIDCVNAILDKSVTSHAMFGVFRHQRDGFVDEGVRRRMRLLAPHVRRAVLIGKTIDLKEAQIASLADTLDTISAAMFLVEATGRIVHANAAGHAMLAEGSALHALDRKLAAHDPGNDRALHDTFLAAANGDASIGLKGIAVPLTARDGERLVAHVLPLTSGARRRAGNAYSAVAAVFVHRAALDIPSPPEAIAKTYQLTPTELRVLLAIVEIGGVPEVAEALGVAETTVKFHLRHLFEKTDAKRQADLVKLVAGFAGPLSH